MESNNSFYESLDDDTATYIYSALFSLSLRDTLITTNNEVQRVCNGILNEDIGNYKDKYVRCIVYKNKVTFPDGSIYYIIASDPILEHRLTISSQRDYNPGSKEPRWISNPNETQSKTYLISSEKGLEYGYYMINNKLKEDIGNLKAGELYNFHKPLHSHFVEVYKYGEKVIANSKFYGYLGLYYAKPLLIRGGEKL